MPDAVQPFNVGDLVELRNPFKTRDIVNGVEIEYLIDPTVRLGIITRVVKPKNTPSDIYGFDVMVDGKVLEGFLTSMWDVKKVSAD
jgi:hypothetical protein